jgi:hypothetical protein
MSGAVKNTKLASLRATLKGKFLSAQAPLDNAVNPSPVPDAVRTAVRTSRR